MIYWETYLVKPFATLNTLISAEMSTRASQTVWQMATYKYHYV
ncbi:hypothetical protein T11_11207 [Trichinella zimbabwensis]|uniref:Uncharacterized protein n=1 Tax=Trichinella zimbabwensis TaxID=268475 RepID=A0A0V1GFV5_9BILA|nr:hypothetical protein T11_11207 [Trichinella zimbabwensis]